MTIGYKFDEIVIRQLAGRRFTFLGRWNEGENEDVDLGFVERWN